VQDLVGVSPSLCPKNEGNFASFNHISGKCTICSLSTQSAYPHAILWPFTVKQCKFVLLMCTLLMQSPCHANQQ